MDDETTEAPAKKEKPVFPGFNTSFKGYSQLPNEWLDEIISQIDNIAELKVVLYIYRHTWGYQEKKINPDDPAKHDEIKRITTDEFMHGRKKADGTRMDRGTGLSNRSVIDGLRNAVKHGYILETVDDRDKGRVVKSYALNMLKSTENSCEESSQGDVKNLHRGMKPPHNNCEETSHRSEKKPRERNRKKERMKESASRNVASENRTSDSTEPFFHSFTHSSLPDFCLEKIEQVAQTCGEDVDEYLEEAEELYQQSNKSEDIFYDLLFNAEAYINRYGPKTMQGFWDNMRKFLKAS